VGKPLVIVVVLAFLAGFGCARDEPEGAWVRADMMTLPEGVSGDDLPAADSRGARLAVAFCSQCHGVPTPKRHSAGDWISTLRRMFVRMDHMAGMGGMMGRRGMMGRGRREMPMGMHGVEVPSEEDKRALVEYYTANALRATEPEAVPAGKGVERFRDRCARCHALPDPGQYEPGEWPDVVERMRENMRATGVGDLSDDEATAIAAYLARAARAANGPRRTNPRREE